MDDQQRNLQALAMTNSDVFRAAAKRLSDIITAKVMHPSTAPDVRAEALLEYHALSRIISIIDNWAVTGRGDQEDA